MPQYPSPQCPRIDQIISYIEFTKSLLNESDLLNDDIAYALDNAISEIEVVRDRMESLRAYADEKAEESDKLEYVRSNLEDCQQALEETIEEKESLESKLEEIYNEREII